MLADRSWTGALLLGAAFILTGCDVAQGATARPEQAVPPEAVHGERLAARHCATCHALQADRPSLLADAPSFPKLRARYSSKDMAAVLGRRMTETHPRMPLLDLGPDELNAFLAYWETVPHGDKPGKSPGSTKVDIGRTIVVRDCGGCHATGADDRSAFAPAPPFRVLGSRYELEGLAEALAEGISVGHSAMPQLAYPSDEVEAIIAYLKSVQPPGKPRVRSQP